MPDGARNGISSDKNSDTDFLCDEEDEDEENQRLKKAFNLNFIFDLFRAAIMDKKIGGDKNGNSSPRLSTCSMDSDYVMLVLNEKQKENDEISILIDRLRQNGVTCIFFKGNDIRNGTTKLSSEVSELTKLKPSTQSNFPNQYSEASTNITNQQQQHPLEKDTNSISSAASFLLNKEHCSPAQPVVQNCNGIDDDKFISTISIPIVPIVFSSPPCITGSRNRIRVATCPSPLPPLLSPQVQLPIEKDNHQKSTDLNEVKEIPCTSLDLNPKEEESPVATLNINHEPPARKKRRKRRKHPFVTRKPVKKKNIWKELIKSEKNDSFCFGTPAAENSLIVKDVDAAPDFKHTNYNSNTNTAISSTLLSEDPYVFIPDDDDFDCPPPIERSYSPKKGRKNGTIEDDHQKGGVVVVKVKGIRSPSPKVSVRYTENNSSSSPTLKTPEKTAEAITLNSRNFSPDITTGISSIGRSRVRTFRADSIFPVVKQKKRKKKRTSPFKSNKKSKVQKTEICVQSISSTTTVTEPETRKDIKVNILKETFPSTDYKREVLDKSILKEQLELERNVNTTQEVEDIIDGNSKSGNGNSESKSGVPPPVLLKSNDEKEVLEETVPKCSTNPIKTPNSNAAVIEIKTEDAQAICEKYPPHEETHELDLAAETTFMEAMQLRRSSFYSQIAGNVRNNLENHLDGRSQNVKVSKRRKRARNGFLLHHGDNFPEDPEAPYKLHLATQIILKLNKRRCKFKPKVENRKSLLSYLKLVPTKRSSRAGKSIAPPPPDEPLNDSQEETTVFSGEWIQARYYVCNVCGHVEDYFWNMVHHKGEIHPGVVVTHVELPCLPPEGFRVPPPVPSTSSLPPPPPCTKCSASFSNYPDLHRHIFECAGNAGWLEEIQPEPQPTPKKKPKRKRGFNSFKRRLSNTPKKANLKKNDANSPTKRRNFEVFKCEFCTREFKTEGWLKNHLSSHTLPISIPLNKLTLPPRASFNYTRRSCVQNLIANNANNVNFKTG